jgi:hypothetical protein
MPTPRSNISSLCDNDSPSSIFLAPSEDLITASSIDHTSFPTDPLTVLLYSRGLEPQKRWDDCGKVHEVTPHEAVFDRQIVSLFSSQSKLEKSIEFCIQLGLVEQSWLEDGSVMYSISDQSRHQISQSLKGEELQLLGLMFTAHIYPRDQTLEPT